MKTFEDELMNLTEWLMARREESYKLPNDSNGLDGGQRHSQEKLDYAEYRRRLRVLEEKYKIKTA